MYQQYNNFNMYNNMNNALYNQNIQYQNNNTQLVNGGNWRLPYLNSNNDNIKEQPKIQDKYSIIFNTSSGHKTSVIIDEDKTISHLIQVYLAKVGNPQLYMKTDMIKFLYCSKQIPMDSQEKIKDYFTFSFSPNITILVIDIKNLIGA